MALDVSRVQNANFPGDRFGSGWKKVHDGTATNRESYTNLCTKVN